MSFVKRSDAAPVCHSKPLDSVKNWNDHFLWVDSTAFPLSVSLKSKILSKDPPPKLSQYDTEACDFLRTYTAPFQKFLEPFLCWIGISRYYTLDENCYPTFWDGGEEMDLFAFIRHSNPTKVLIKEVKLLTLTEGRVVSLAPLTSAASGDSSDSIDKLFDDGNDAEPEHPTIGDDDVLAETVAKDVSEVAIEKTKKSKRKRKTTGDASVSTFPPKKLREDYHAVTSNTGGKSLVTIRSLISEGSSVPSEIAEPRDDVLADSVSELNLRTRPPSKRYVISSDDWYHSDSRSEVNFFAKSSVADTPVMTIFVTTTVAADASVVQISKDRVRSGNLKTFGDSASAGRANANAASSSKLNEPTTSSDSFYASRDLDSETLHNIYVPKWKVMNDSVLDDPYVCRDLTDRLAPPALFSQLRSMDYDQLYTEFNVGAARHMCLGAEVRMRAEHTLEQKDRLKDKCAEQTAILLEKDVEIAHLRSLLSLREAEAAEAIQRNFALEGEKDALSEKVATLESVTTSKETELASLTAQVVQLTSDLSGFQLSRDELSSKVAFLESERNRLADQSTFELFKGCMEAMQDEQATVLGNRVAKLDAQLLEMAAHLDEEFYPHFLTTIFGRRWILTHGLKLVLLKCLQSLEYCHALGKAIGCAVNKGIQDGLRAGVDHGKAGRDLSVIEAYDPSAEAKYIDIVNALGTVDFSLLSELKSKKDASIVDLIDSLRLEGPLAEIPGAEDLQPFPAQLMLPIHRPKDGVVLGETSLSFSLQVVHSRVQRVRGEIKEKRSSLMDGMIPLVEPLSSKSLTSEASTSAAPTTSEPITTLSMTFASSEVVLPLSISNDQVLDTEHHDEDPHVVTFEKEELDTSPE
ncbi:hypothetical protein Tco_0259895 [Tanacetum coccineum]